MSENSGMTDAQRLTEARTEVSELTDVLHRNGFVRCDIAACNCGSWHARYGLRERMNEIIRELTDAGVLNNATGNLPLSAINHLIADRDRLAAEVLRLTAALQKISDHPASSWPEKWIHWADIARATLSPATSTGSEN